MKRLSNIRNIYYKRSIVLLIILSIIWLSICGYTYIFRTSNYETEEVTDSLKTITHNNSSMVEFDFDKFINILSLTANYFEDVNMDTDYFELKFNELVTLENFDKVATVLPNGESYVSNGLEFTKSNYEFTSDMDTHKVFISDVYYDSEELGDAVSINVPVIDSENGDLLAYLIGILSVKNLSNIFNDLFYTLDGYYHIIDSNGKYVAMSNSESMLYMDTTFTSGIKNVDFLYGYNSEMILNDFDKRNEGITKYKSDGKNRYAYYTPININDWVMYNVVLESDMTSDIMYHITNAVLLCLGFVIMFVIYLIFILKAQRQFNKKALEYEYNFRFVSEQIKKYIVEWNFTRDDFIIRGNINNTLNKNAHTGKWSKDLSNGFIHKDDIDKVTRKIEEVKDGKTISDLRIRVHNEDNKYMWYALNIVPVKKENEKEVKKAIGLLENIEDIVKESNELKKQSEIDSLTKIYNKGTTEKLIKNIIADSDKAKNRYALLIIDVDNFKEINDRLGHQYGDKVLVELAQELLKMFRSEDIIGRIGGDEYFAFMKNIPNTEIVIKKAEKICKEFNKTYISDDKTVTISASVGISIYPNHAESFDVLYRSADLALYESKERGKNTYTIYSGQSISKYQSKRTTIESIKTKDK